MAETRRRDLLAECNADHHPIDAFSKECCANCFNRECTRSLSGKLKFDARTSTWYERFFGDKDVMDPNDARFASIAAQRFMVINPSRAQEVGSSWADPRDLNNPAPPQVQVVSLPEPPAPKIEVPEPPRVVVPSAPVNLKLRRDVPVHLLLANAPSQNGQMVAAPPSASIEPAPTQDPWTAPVQPPKSDVPVVSSGARVKMGGGGV